MPRYYGNRRSYRPRGRYNYRRPYQRTRMPKAKSEADIAWSLAKKAMRGVNAIRKLVNVEHKFVTQEDITPVASSTGSVTLLNGVARGDTAESRDGASIRFTRFLGNFQLKMSSSGYNTWTRVILFVYHENNASAKVLGNILQTSDTKAMLQEDNESKFTVLKDRTFAQTVTASQTAAWTWDVPLNFHSTYTVGASTGAATDLQTGALYLLVLSNEATNTPTLSLTCRSTFIDN